MIWVATLLLLVLAAWFIIEGNNERRWVQDHMDDEAVAADKGLFPKYDALKDAPEPQERYSVAQSESKVGRFAAKAKAKSGAVGDAFERRAGSNSGNNESAAAEKRQKRVERGNTLTGPDSFIGKTAQRLSEKTEAISEKIPAGRLVSDSAYGEQEPSAARRAIKSITDRLDRIDAKTNQS